MERTNNKVEPEEVKVKWEKTGGGSFRLENNRIIKPGQIFSAYPSQIPLSFRDTVIALEDLPPPPEEKVLEVASPAYTLKSRGSGGWYDIIDSEGKVVNEKALKREAALKFIEDLVE